MLIVIALLGIPLAWVGSVFRDHQAQEALLDSLKRTARIVETGKVWPKWQRGTSMTPERWPSLGRVTSLECWADGLPLQCLSGIGALRALHRLALIGVVLRPGDAIAISELPRLEELLLLDLRSLSVDEEAIGSIGGGPIEYILGTWKFDGLSFSSKEAELVDAIDAAAPAPVDDDALFAVTNARALKRLALPIQRLEGASAQAIERMQSLEELCLLGCRVSDGACASLAKLRKLRHLYLAECRVSDVGLAYLGRLTQLRHLCLTGCTVSDSGIAVLAGMRGLEVLRLNSPFITNAGLTQLSAMRLASTVTDLDLSTCSLDDKGILPLLCFKTLRALTLDCTKVGDKGLLILSRSPTIERGSVSLSDTRQTNHMLWMEYLQGRSAEDLRRRFGPGCDPEKLP